MTIITTHSGQRVNIEAPDPDIIRIEDIAHALPFSAADAARQMSSFRWRGTACTAPVKRWRVAFPARRRWPACSTMPPRRT